LSEVGPRAERGSASGQPARVCIAQLEKQGENQASASRIATADHFGRVDISTGRTGEPAVRSVGIIHSDRPLVFWRGAIVDGEAFYTSEASDVRADRGGHTRRTPVVASAVDVKVARVRDRAAGRLALRSDPLARYAVRVNSFELRALSQLRDGLCAWREGIRHNHTQRMGTRF
jgi:hypothetical protein